MSGTDSDLRVARASFFGITGTHHHVTEDQIRMECPAARAFGLYDSSKLHISEGSFTTSKLKERNLVTADGQFVKDATDDQAAYMAAIAAAEAAAERDVTELHLRGSSSVVLASLRDGYQPNATYRLLRRQAQDALAAFDTWTVEYTDPWRCFPIATDLANEALDEGTFEPAYAP